MSSKLPISVVVLTHNEELNLPKCLRSVAHRAGEIIVVDSGSTDRTQAIAKEFGATVVTHPFTNQAEQFNWAIDNVPMKGEWIFRLDADEEVLVELWEEIAAKLPETAADVSGFMMKRRVYFMDRWIRYGGYYPTWFLRLFRKGLGRSEEREMDEHIVLVEGRAEELEDDFVDRNLKGLSAWTAKHNDYSTREVAATMRERASVIPANAGIQQRIHAGFRHSGRNDKLAGQPASKRRLKGWYMHSPPFLRAFAYFLYRYFLRLGFLDGKEGLIFHTLHAFWYRFLVDAKLYEARRNVQG